MMLLAAVAVVPTAAIAARSAPGDGVLELRSVNGLVVLTAKGVLWGQMDRGVMRITDLDPLVGKPPFVSGATHTRVTDDPNTTVYTGGNVHFRLTGGRYRIRFHGTSIDLTAVGVGTGSLVGEPNGMGKTGDYAVDGGTWTPVPLFERDVPFGATVAGTPTPSPGPGP